MKQIIFAILISSFIYTQCPGDVNDDSVINIQDVVMVVGNIVYGTDFNPYADLNGDGYIDILDIVSIINIILNEVSACIDIIDITYNIHDSLPEDWIDEFYIILDNLSGLVPAYQNYFDDLTVYAWNSNVADPYLGIQAHFPKFPPL